MKLLPTQTDEQSLRGFGEEASVMLMQGDYSGLARRLGYALAYDREPAVAIEADYLRAASAPIKPADEIGKQIIVKYFKRNNVGLFALVECTIPVTKGEVLLELIVTGNGEEKHISIEDITGAMTE